VNAILLLMGLLVLSYLGSFLVTGRTVRGAGLPSGVEYVALGFVLGPRALDLVGADNLAAFEPVVQVALGWLAIFFVFKENSFASATIEIAANQKVITTGPYALVRHPMYFGAGLTDCFIPLALGSWWALLPVAVKVPVIMLRVLDEEELLRANLSGYIDYCQKVPHRLIPAVW